MAAVLLRLSVCLSVACRPAVAVSLQATAVVSVKRGYLGGGPPPAVRVPVSRLQAGRGGQPTGDCGCKCEAVVSVKRGYLGGGPPPAVRVLVSCLQAGRGGQSTGDCGCKREAGVPWRRSSSGCPCACQSPAGRPWWSAYRRLRL